MTMLLSWHDSSSSPSRESDILFVINWYERMYIFICLTVSSSTTTFASFFFCVFLCNQMLLPNVPLALLAFLTNFALFLFLQLSDAILQCILQPCKQIQGKDANRPGNMAGEFVSPKTERQQQLPSSLSMSSSSRRLARGSRESLDSLSRDLPRQ